MSRCDDNQDYPSRPSVKGTSEKTVSYPSCFINTTSVDEVFTCSDYFSFLPSLCTLEAGTFAQNFKTFKTSRLFPAKTKTNRDWLQKSLGRTTRSKGTNKLENFLFHKPCSVWGLFTHWLCLKKDVFTKPPLFLFGYTNTAQTGSALCQCVPKHNKMAVGNQHHWV